MCDVRPHDTGWKVVRTEYDGLFKNTTLWLRCRTKHCVETREKVVKGYWTAADFDTVYDA